MTMFSSVRFRLVLWNVSVLAVILVIFAYSLRFEIQEDLLSGIDAGLEKSSSRAQDGVDSTGTLPLYLTQRVLSANEYRSAGSANASTLSQPLTFAVSIIDVYSVSSHTAPVILDPSTVGRSINGQRVYSTTRLGHIPIRVLSSPIYLHGKVVYVIQFARSLVQLNSQVAGISRGFLTLIPLALLIVGVGALLLTERALLPVRDIVSSTERIEAKDLSGRLTVTGHDEFSHLAITINGMLERLDKAFTLLQEASDKQRRFTADASHELRTPLTIIKANTSLALSVERTPDEYRRTLSAVDRAADRMSKIVMDLLYIARSDAGTVFTASEPVNVRSVVNQSVEAVADPDRHKIVVEGDGCWASGDEESLIRLFGNLLQNAYKYTPPGGLITIRCSNDHEWCTLKVVDTGIGIAPEHISHLGERFFRIDDARGRDGGGTGLGLAICRSIVEAHGGMISFDSAIGVGTTVTVKIPVTEKPNNGRKLDQQSAMVAQTRSL